MNDFCSSTFTNPLYTSRYLLFTVLFISQLCYSSVLQAQEGHETKLLFGSTAKPLGAGHGYVQTIDGLVNQGEIGLTSYLSVGIGGVIIPSGVVGGGLRAKVSFPIADNMYLGLGTYVILADYVSVAPMALFSVDVNKIQLNAAVGFIKEFDTDDESNPINPLISVGAIFPIFKNGYLVSENWISFFSNNKTDLGYLYFPGLTVRWNVNRFSFELGAIGILGNDGDGGIYRALPHLAISYIF